MTAEPIWRKSSFSGNISCVEVTRCAGATAVRDSKAPMRVLYVTPGGVRRLISFAQM
ncbi:DUF397 domain-containing protein [Actinophytocola oryzae]|uniref:Uncharacterized protein DUF397 n=1 Tax=Actinophytocola oryzae TaxID=502181 RepID=A0A4R7UQD5_9PSEU|nr:DUF397 domain-containing protein [Actinophytocola oryzae]TDV36638.1 uncharacterized protein DUF397 [Actinophytocola oryzae]